jgi:hypothetical protein
VNELTDEHMAQAAELYSAPAKLKAAETERDELRAKLARIVEAWEKVTKTQPPLNEMLLEMQQAIEAAK